MPRHYRSISPRSFTHYGHAHGNRSRHTAIDNIMRASGSATGQSAPAFGTGQRHVGHRVRHRPQFTIATSAAPHCRASPARATASVHRRSSPAGVGVTTARRRRRRLAAPAPGHTVRHIAGVYGTPQRHRHGRDANRLTILVPRSGIRVYYLISSPFNYSSYSRLSHTFGRFRRLYFTRPLHAALLRLQHYAPGSTVLSNIQFLLSSSSSDRSTIIRDAFAPITSSTLF